MNVPSVEEFWRTIEVEFCLSSDDRSRIERISFGDEQSMKKNWAVIALSTKKFLEDDYRNGEIRFHDMLETMRKLSLGLPAPHRLYFLGAIAEFGLKTPQPVKETGKGLSDFPQNPRWYKRMIVDLFDMVRNCNPQLVIFSESGECVYKETAKFLAELQIPMPALKTLEAWQREPQNRDIQEYRFTKQTRNPKDDI